MRENPMTLDEAALRKAGIEGVDEWVAVMDSPAARFHRLPIEQARELTHAAAVEAAHAFMQDPGGYLDAEGHPDPLRAFYALGHLSHTRDLPTYALLVLNFGALDLDTRRDLTVFAWRVPEWPHAGQNTDLWHSAWARAGFCSDVEDVERPTEPVVVYRGAAAKFKRGLAWTADIERARWFGRRFPAGGTFGLCRIYTATADPARLYARIVGRGEDEWVVDTRGLPIHTLEVCRGD